jgi:hypothetical protein
MSLSLITTSLWKHSDDGQVSMMARSIVSCSTERGAPQTVESELLHVIAPMSLKKG